MPRPPAKRRKATLASLAAELGVSRTTVSNAYNRPDQLSSQLRARVLDAARQLGYPGPDPVARSLRTQQAGAVGLIFTETLSYAFRDPAAVAFLEGLALACEQDGTGLLLVPAGPGSDIDARMVHRAAVDGFVVYSMPDDDVHLAAVLRRALPTVIVDEPVGVPAVDFVGIDDRAVCAAMGRHLADLGHRRVGVICARLSSDRNDGPADLSRQRGSIYALERLRLAGFADGLAARGVAWVGVPVEERFDHTLEAGAHATRALLDRYPDLTAIACTTDVLALGALAEARRRGLTVPEDLSLTGFDDVREAAGAGLTTVRQPMVEKGRTAGRLLLEPTEGAEPRTVRLSAQLVVRHSTAPPRRSPVRLP
ncbi:MAG TPA: LacI family DNA-binding transcriptional regulator [Mycobacteriales bacterium]